MPTTIALSHTAAPAVAFRAPARRLPARPRTTRRNVWAEGAGESRVATAATVLLAVCLAPVIAAAFAQVFIG